MICTTIALLSLSLTVAAPKTTHFYPSAVTRGAFPVLVTAEGDAGTDSKIWVDDPKLVVISGPKSGQFLIEAKPECPPGWHVVRLHNKEGATNPIPVWVDDLPNFAESEPNNTPHQANSISLAPGGGVAHLHGRLEKNGDVDGFRVHVPAGTTLVARVEANRHLDSPMDATLQIVNLKGFVLSHNDDSRGVDPELAWTASEPTDVIVRLFAFPSAPNSTIGFAGGSNYLYRISLSTDATVDHLHTIAVKDGEKQQKPVGWNLPLTRQPLSMEPRGFYVLTGIVGSEMILAPQTNLDLLALDQTEKPQITRFPIMITGTIESESVSHQFQINATKGETYVFRVFANQWESLLDPLLIIRDAKGQIIVEQDDTSNNSKDLETTFTPTSDGLFNVEISDLHNRGGLRMFYGIECTKDGLPPVLNLSTTNLAIKSGQKLDLTLTYDKRADVDLPLSVDFQGLPKGFPPLKLADPNAATTPTDASKNTSGRRRRGSNPAGVTTLKYPIELTADQTKAIGEWSGPVQILAKDNSGKAIPVQIGGIKGARLGLDHIWFNVLAVEEKKEDKKEEKK